MYASCCSNRSFSTGKSIEKLPEHGVRVGTSNWKLFFFFRCAGGAEIAIFHRQKVCARLTLRQHRDWGRRVRADRRKQVSEGREENRQTLSPRLGMRVDSRAKLLTD
eukprot:80856-Rhodomonas_salina.1